MRRIGKGVGGDGEEKLFMIILVVSCLVKDGGGADNFRPMISEGRKGMHEV